MAVMLEDKHYVTGHAVFGDLSPFDVHGLSNNIDASNVPQRLADFVHNLCDRVLKTCWRSQSVQ